MKARKEAKQLPELPDGISYHQGILFSWVCDECAFVVGGGIMNDKTKQTLIEETGRTYCPECCGSVSMKFGDDRALGVLREMLE